MYIYIQIYNVIYIYIYIYIQQMHQLSFYSVEKHFCFAHNQISYLDTLGPGTGPWPKQERGSRAPCALFWVRARVPGPMCPSNLFYCEQNRNGFLRSKTTVSAFVVYIYIYLYVYIYIYIYTYDPVYMTLYI